MTGLAATWSCVCKDPKTQMIICHADQQQTRLAHAPSGNLNHSGKHLTCKAPSPPLPTRIIACRDADRASEPPTPNPDAVGLLSAPTPVL